MRCRTCPYGIPLKDRCLSALIGIEATLLFYFCGIIASTITALKLPTGTLALISMVIGAIVFTFTLWRVKNSTCPICPRK
jgi:hypothetical protein